jgi:hypothetical protein
MWSEFTINNFKFNNNNILINEQFINKIKQIRHEINKLPNVDYTINKTIISTDKIKELLDSPWVSPDLYYDNLTYDVNVSWGNNNLYIKTTKEKFIKFKKRLPTFLKIINFIKLNNSTDINIYLILSYLTKYLEIDKIISPKHINSGYTNTITNDIFIWREEEFEKVTFHELMHLFLHDHRDENIKLPVQIDGPESFYEAITDFKAIIFNIIYISLLTKIKISLILKYELEFIYNQAKKINYYLNNCKEDNIIIQNSPAYSYYILKYFIFTYFSENENDTLFNNIFFKNKNYNKLIKLIKDYKIKDNNFINFNSARMTLFELK